MGGEHHKSANIGGHNPHILLLFPFPQGAVLSSVKLESVPVVPRLSLFPVPVPMYEITVSWQTQPVTISPSVCEGQKEGNAFPCLVGDELDIIRQEATPAT